MHCISVAFSVGRQDAHPCELQVTISQVLVLVIQSFFCVCSLVRRGYEQGKAVLVFLSQSMIFFLDVTIQSSLLGWGTVLSCLFRYNNKELSIGMGNGSVLSFSI